MFDILVALDFLSRDKLQELWSNRTPFESMVDLPRLEYAKSVVENSILPISAPGNLEQTGQVNDAANFVANKLANRARKANPDPIRALSLIIKTACVQFKIQDKSHICIYFCYRPS